MSKAILTLTDTEETVNVVIDFFKDTGERGLDEESGAHDVMTTILGRLAEAQEEK